MQFAGEMSNSKKEAADNTKDKDKCKSNSSQVKRRRMLQFDSVAIPIPYSDEDMPPTTLKEKVCFNICTYLLQYLGV